MVMMMIMGKRFFQLLQVFFVLLLCKKPATGFNSAVGDANIECIEKEREALLTFKQGLVDSYGRLSSWGNEDGKKDCCKWRGIKCSNQTGHVIMLDLQFDMSSFFSSRASMPFFDASGPPLRGKISPSLLELQHLSYLDLSFNDFERSPIPMFIGYLTNLRYLNFSGANFAGTLPSHLGNLSNLQYLDLGWNTDISPSDNPISLIDVENLEWLSHLSSLRHLDLSGVNLAKSIDWLQVINTLPSLSELHLSSCQLSGVVPPSLSFINSSTSLAILDLSSNYLSPSIYHWLFNFSGSLVHLDLSDNQLQGPLPDAFQKMKSLARLFLSVNKLEGRIPKSFGNLCALQTLDFSWNNFTIKLPKFVQTLMSACVENSLETLLLNNNRLSGSLPDMTRFSSLQELDLSKNRLNGFFNEKFGRLSALVVLDLHANGIRGSLPDLTYLSSLRQLCLAKNQLNGTLTKTIGHLSKLELLDVSFNSLEGIISEAHLLNLPRLKYLDLSFNSLSLDLSSHWVPPFQLDTIRLGACKLGPHFPKWLQTQKNFSYIDMSSNGISNSIPQWFWDLSPILHYLNLSCNQIKGRLPDLSLKFSGFPGIDLSSNHLDGPLPLFPSNLTSLNLSKNKFSGSISFLSAINGASLIYIDLSDNLLSGGLPDCWINFPELVILDLANNNLFGKIPSSIGFLDKIKTLNLRNNSLGGEFPSTLKNCMSLKVLDLGENKLSGKIPSWIGESLSRLIVLSLRSNELYGSIPGHLCHLIYLQILDLSHNNISGTIPQCINNFTAMSQKGSLSVTISHSYFSSVDGDDWTFSVANFADNALIVMKGLVLEYRRYLGLVKIIDLSSNRLTGEIPGDIASLKELVALNLSRNNLTGQIPPMIGQMKMLESLDLSSNRLFGGIPASFSNLNFLSFLDLSNNYLSGKIPSSTQLQSFNASVYMGNLDLCGPPLPNKCSGDETAQDPLNTGRSEDSNIQEDEDGFITPGFYFSAALGFPVGFWAVFGTFIFNASWRHAYFHFLENMHEKEALHDNSRELSQFAKAASRLSGEVGGLRGLANCRKETERHIAMNF